MPRRDGGQGGAQPSPRAAASAAPAHGIDWPATLAARGGGRLRQAHLQRLVPEPADAVLHCFLLDCSASMRSAGSLARAKGLLLGMLAEAYRRRERVALLCFGGDRVELRLPPRRAAGWNERWIDPICGGGGTPLARGVAAADRLLQRDRAPRRLLWLLTDGRSREAPRRPAAADTVGIVDFETARMPFGRAARLATAWGACYQRFDDIAAAEAEAGAAKPPSR